MGCSASSDPTPPPAPTPSASTPAPLDPAAIVPGDWSCRDSTARFSLALTDGVLAVTGVDTRDGEVFEISEVGWDGRVARFTSRMPSTGHTVQNTLRVKDRNHLRLGRAGDGSFSCVASRAPAQAPPAGR